MSYSARRFTVLAICLIVLGAMNVCAAATYLPGGGVTQNTANLPPLGSYVTPQSVHACFTAGPDTACIQNTVHYGFGLPNTSQVNGGADQLESFSSNLSGELFLNGGDAGPVTMQGPVTVILHGRPGGNGTTGEWNTEMLALDLTGFNPTIGPFMIRESPTLPSLGSTKITDIGGGRFHIDSFFDVFTELSIDGGQSWIPSASSAHVDLVDLPEPTTLLLAGAALIGLASIRRRALR